VWLGTARGEAFRARMEAWLMRGVNLWVLFLPVGINKVLLDKFPPTTALINDPWYFNHLLIFFLYGNFFGRSPRLWEHMVARRKLLTGGAVVFTGLVLAPGQFPHVLEILALRLAAWSAMLVVLAWTRTLVTTAPAWLQYARERSFPFYIMHMVVLVVMAYWVLPLPLGTWTSLMLLFVSTLLGTWLLTELCFHVPLLRPFVGLKFRRTDRRPQLAPFPPPAA
jgi:surface polysaccharide O-acyltransferase-like enzyme